MKKHRHDLTSIFVGSLLGISVLVTLLSAVGYFFLTDARKFYSYPFYQQISLFVYQSQEDDASALFRIPGIFLLGGCLGFILFLWLTVLIRDLFPVKKEERWKSSAKHKKLPPQKFKSPSPLMFLKWGLVLIYLAAIFYFAGYYFNDILNPIDIWMHYVLLYMYSILGGICLNLFFNLSKPLRTNRYLELTSLCLLGGGFALAYFYLDILGISSVYYIHCCILFGIIATINAFDFCSINAHRCPECHGRCGETLISSKYTDLGTGIGFEDRVRKVGTRETTYTISTDKGEVIGEAKGSEDIYEHYTGTYETHESETENIYDCECVHCHRREKTHEIHHHSSRV